MGKSEVDLGDEINEINKHAEAIAAAVKRKEQRETNATRPLDAEPRGGNAGTVRGVTGAADRGNGRRPQAEISPGLEVVEGNENGGPQTRRKRSYRRPKKSTHRTPSVGPQLSEKDDPWVTDSIKVRHSNKRRLKELSLRRQLDRESPYQKKDLVDEALDYIFGKYEKR